jgi:hypothetical protein
MIKMFVPSRQIGKTFAMAIKMNTYKDESGNLYMIRQGLGGNCWMTMRMKAGKTGWCRVVSKDLPVRICASNSKDAAQRDLDAWAKKKHLQEIA